MQEPIELIFTPMAVKPIAVLVAALSGFAVGGIWYGPLFGKSWMVASGLTMEDLQRDASPVRTYGTAFVANFIGAWVLAAVLGTDATPMDGAFVGGVIGLAWVATALATIYAFERRGPLLLMINAAYQVVALAVTGAIIGLLQ